MQREKGQIPLVAVVGPTASGKSDLAVQLAKALDGEIVSADSKQIYRYMTVGTAVPTREEKQGIPHHLMQFLSPDETFSVAEYVKCAGECIQEIDRRKKLPILVGGTGLYISSLLDNITFFETKSDPLMRSELEQLANDRGNEFLLDMLAQIDPDLAQKLHPNNLGRIIRGIEAYRLTGKTMTQLQAQSRLEPSPYRAVMIGLNYKDRQTLYRRIDTRVQKMIEQGLLEEIKNLIHLGYSQTAAQAIGYKEFFDYLAGRGSLEDAISAVQQESRRYAKRQMTWFRRDERIRWLYVDEYEEDSCLVRDAITLVQNQLG